jgi:DNA mismatch repair protein MutS
LDAVETLCAKLSGVRLTLLSEAAAQMDPLPDLRARIVRTLANAERFVSRKLEEYEAKVLGTQERLAALGVQLFEQLVSEVAARHASLSTTAAALGRVDVLAALAQVAERHCYARPTLTRERRLVIEDGRHPVVELMAGWQGFVPNDCLLEPTDQQILILTGPNIG